MFTAFSTGQCATSFMWNGGMGDLSNPDKSQVAGKFGIVPTPKVSLLGGWTLTVSEYSQNKEAAYLYLAWFSSPEIVKKMAMKTGAPARPSVISDPEVQAKYPYLKTTVEALKTSIEFPPIKEVDQIFAWISIEGNAAVSGAKTPEQAAHDLQAEVLEMMTKQGYFKQ
jgi:multiple sugar transport system substrate-binding protein